MKTAGLSIGISVPYGYCVYFTGNAFSRKNPLLANIVLEKNGGRPARLLFFVEKKLCRHHPRLTEEIEVCCGRHPEIFELCRPPVVRSGGENLKSFKAISELCEIIGKNRLCRHSFVCIVGGGAFLDTVGFAASVVHRGIRQIRIPTTVLAQADSGVGVKNGINMFGMKNLIGTFAPPFAVINDFEFLKTLSYRDWISGAAEAFKVAMIKDADFFRWLCRNAGNLAAREQRAMERMIFRCAALHLEHIGTSGDPFEFGSARPLDFGHWAAHKLEMMSGGRIRHGEAVAIGLALDSYYACRKGLLDEASFRKLLASFKSLGFKLHHPLVKRRKPDGRLELLDGIEEFREHLGGELHITLPDGLGRKTEVNRLDEKTILCGINLFSAPECGKNLIAV